MPVKTPKRPARETSPEEVARRIREAGERAKKEAEARRVVAAAKAPAPQEIGGRNGPEPTRYGDWERNGIISDF